MMQWLALLPDYFGKPVIRLDFPVLQTGGRFWFLWIKSNFNTCFFSFSYTKPTIFGIFPVSMCYCNTNYPDKVTIIWQLN